MAHFEIHIVLCERPKAVIKFAHYHSPCDLVPQRYFAQVGQPESNIHKRIMSVARSLRGGKTSPFAHFQNCKDFLEGHRIKSILEEHSACASLLSNGADS